MKFYVQVLAASEKGCKLLVAEKTSFDKTGKIDKTLMKQIDLKKVNVNSVFSFWQFTSDGFLVIDSPPGIAMAPFHGSSFTFADDLLDWSGNPKWA